MFFIISQKINNLLLKTNDIFNYKIGIIGLLIYVRHSVYIFLLSLKFLIFMITRYIDVYFLLMKENLK